MEMPCLDKIIGIIFKAMRDETPILDQLTLWGLYGDPKYRCVEMTHKWAWSFFELEGVLTKAGFSQIEFMEPLTHKPVRDMRVEAIK